MEQNSNIFNFELNKFSTFGLVRKIFFYVTNNAISTNKEVNEVSEGENNSTSCNLRTQTETFLYNSSRQSFYPTLLYHKRKTAWAPFPPTPTEKSSKIVILNS